MRNYVVAYIINSNEYRVKFVIAEDSIQACTKVIPGFQKLLDYVRQHYSSLDYETIIRHRQLINLIDFDVLEVDSLSEHGNIKTQIVVCYDTNRNTLSIVKHSENRKLDALAVTIMNCGYYTEEMENLRQYNNIRQMILVFAHLSGIRVYTVSTLRALVKESLNN